jgi:hypothetical protein
MAADTLSPHVSDEEETNARRGLKREGSKTFSLGKYETIKKEYRETPGESLSQKLSKMRELK